jgi:hypothetical protein
VNFKINTNIAIIFSSLLVAVLLFVAILRGSSAGKDTAQATAVIGTAKNITTALDYFYSDQNRYPNVSEFGEQNIMLNYLNVFPVPNFISAVCQESFVYKKDSASTASLSFCLPKASGAYAQGWNVLSLNK